MTFSARLISLRNEKFLSQQGIADLTGIHVQQTRRCESGFCEPSSGVLRKLAKTFSISADWPLFDKDERIPSDDLALQSEAVKQFTDDERAAVKEVVESLIIRYRARRRNSERRASPSSRKVRQDDSGPAEMGNMRRSK
ncbi:helix-turn-helix domain-containing protein [Paraburkholderia sp. GAS82]|uniref:helix-turn-helix domain-containing protein n=1 Tax=Paraburkholderia sp. GAS82 TaxID=3035137 RepID=UPI003D1CDD05